MRQAVILAGGQGSRLRERLNGLPKPLIDVDGVPLLGRQIALLRQHGFLDIKILVNYAAERIEAFCAGLGSDLSIETINDGEPRGTAGAVLAALPRCDDRFLVMYGDTLLDVDLGRFWDAHAADQADATLFLHPNDHPADSDLVELDDAGRVTAFRAYPHPPGTHYRNLVNAALYVLETPALHHWADFPVPSDLAKNLFPAMLDAGQTIRGYVSFEYIKDVGTPARLDKAVRHLRTGVVARARLSEPQKAVFLDRDGTLNEWAGYVARPDQLRVLPRAAEAVKRLNEAEFRVVVATNQPVLARGEASVDDMRAIHAKLESDLGRSSAYLDRIELCPHHPDAGFPGEVVALKVACDCRKPKTGLIARAAAALNIDLRRSWMVGDTTSDLQTARNAGLRSILVRTGEGGRDRRYPVMPDAIVADVAEAASFIVEAEPELRRRLAPLVARVGAGDVVLVGGLAQQGKSTAAATLAWHLRDQGLDVAVLNLDRFIRSEADRGQGGVLARFDLARLGPSLSPWAHEHQAARLTLPWYDRESRTRLEDGPDLPLTPETVLIVEGVPALAGVVSDLFGATRTIHRLAVTGDETVRQARVVADLMRRGQAPGEAQATYRSRIADESTLVLDTLAGADLTLTLDDLVVQLAGSPSA